MARKSVSKQLEGKPLPKWASDFKIISPLPSGKIIDLEQELIFAARTLFANGSFTEKAVYLKAAIGAGWIESPAAEKLEIKTVVDGKENIRYEYKVDGEDVDDIHPGKVSYMGEQVVSAYEVATAIPFD